MRLYFLNEERRERSADSPQAQTGKEGCLPGYSSPCLDSSSDDDFARATQRIHELTLQGKTTLYDFYHTLLRLTDNAKLQKPTVSCHLSHLAGRSTRLGYSVSGTGLVICAQHALVRKNGVSDLQKGERCVNGSMIGTPS